MATKRKSAAGSASRSKHLLAADWAYPTVQDWERCAGYKASRAFRAGFRCARDEHEHEAWQTGYDMARMTNALIHALAANQALQALLMFYRDVIGCELGRIDALRAKRPQFVRYAPSQDEVRALLAAVQDLGGYPTRLIVHLLYGCGLRVNEPLDLRIKDVDLSGSRLTIHQAKGAKSRVVPLPCALAEPLRRQIALAAARWEMDVAAGVPVPLPQLLARKYPRNAFARGWYWVFPATSTCRHPRTGEIVRYRCLDTNVQRAVRAAASKCGLSGVVTPHCLRHAYATHALHAGAYVRDVQQVLGHASLETTQGYLHAESGRVASPLDAMGVAP